jgi:colanic acid/amylovoran biosynthesis glycosyltransferase
LAAHRFHFLGKDLLKRARQRGYQKENFVFIPPALSSPVLESSVRHKKYPGGKSLVTEMKILSVGRLVWKKGYDYGLIAISKLKKRNIPFRYSLIGDGEYFEYLQYLIHVYQLEKHVKLLGSLSQEKCIEFYKSHSVFFHPAISEGFCNAVLEAQAFGLISLCGSGEGLHENIIPEKTGFIIDETNPKEVSDKFQWLWESRGRWPEWSNAAQVRAKSFSEQNQVRLFESFYHAP